MLGKYKNIVFLVNNPFDFKRSYHYPAHQPIVYLSQTKCYCHKVLNPLSFLELQPLLRFRETLASELIKINGLLIQGTNSWGGCPRILQNGQKVHEFSPTTSGNGILGLVLLSSKSHGDVHIHFISYQICHPLHQPKNMQ